MFKIFKKIAKPFVALYLLNIKRIENKIGCKVKFGGIASKWIDGCMMYDMTKVWNKNGINALGVNYFTIGTIKEGVSSRFYKDSVQYQSWLGCYLVKFNESRELTIQDHLNLTNADQLNWLSLFGDPDPLCNIDKLNFAEVERIEISGFCGKLYMGGGKSHCDTGRGNRSAKLNLMMAGMAMIFNESNRSLNLTGNNFIPRTKNNYDEIWLEGYVAILDVSNDIKIVAYGNGVSFENEKGRADTFPLIKNDIVLFFKSIQINRIV